ncbi:unnamed protein product [Sphagnum troendelagicum]|uniref:Uncharacterized protein n=1 Tax=Sphagnum troendelagicum TaxID=128251 RepID=A0ABP0TNK0_9BRYO
MHVFPSADCSGIAEQGANFRGPLMSGEMQLNGQAATGLQHRQKNKYTYCRQLPEFNYFFVSHDNFGSNSSTSGLCEPTSLQDSQRTCTKLDISLVQGQEGTMGGIPTLGVEITNVCTGGCPISDVHVACGDFASTMLVNPAMFRRLSLNDCLVNNGNPISDADMIRFEYDNSFMYPMHVQSAVTCHWTS